MNIFGDVGLYFFFLNFWFSFQVFQILHIFITRHFKKHNEIGCFPGGICTQKQWEEVADGLNSFGVSFHESGML